MDTTVSTTSTAPGGTAPRTPGVAAPDEAAAFAEATRLEAAGDPHGALALVRPLVDAHPESLSARLLVARCAARIGAPVVALATAEEATACDPSSWEAQVLVARAAIGIDLDRALEAADRAVAIAPDQPAATEARSKVVAARATREATARPAGGLGKLKAALGPSGKPTSPTPGAVTAPALPPVESMSPEPPTVGLPDAGAHSDDATPPAPLRLPRALEGVVPDGTPEVPASAPAGLAGATDGDATDGAVDGGAATPAPVVARVDHLDQPADQGTEDGKGWDTPGRRILLVLGSLTWLFVGFRYGVQVVGGPVGIALFVGVAAFVALFWRSRLQADGSSSTPTSDGTPAPDTTP